VFGKLASEHLKAQSRSNENLLFAWKNSLINFICHVWLSSSELPRLRADNIRHPSAQIPSLTCQEGFACCGSLPAACQRGAVTLRVSRLVSVRVRVFPASLAERWHFTLTCGLLSVVCLYCFFPKLRISSKSFLCLVSQEAAWCGGCDIGSFRANDRLIHSSVISWLFSLVLWSLIEKTVFSLCVFYL